MRKRFLQVCALAGVLAMAACARAQMPAATGSAEDEAAIRANGPKFAEAWNKGDVAAITAMLADNYQGVDPDGALIEGKAASEAREKEAATQRAGLGLKLSIQTSYIHWVNANNASIGGTWTLAGLPPGAGADKGAWTALTQKSADGQWRIGTSLVAEYHPPAAPPAAPAPDPKSKGSN